MIYALIVAIAALAALSFWAGAVVVAATASRRLADLREQLDAAQGEIEQLRRVMTRRPVGMCDYPPYAHPRGHEEPRKVRLAPNPAATDNPKEANA